MVPSPQTMPYAPGRWHGTPVRSRRCPRKVRRWCRSRHPPRLDDLAPRHGLAKQLRDFGHRRRAEKPASQFVRLAVAEDVDAILTVQVANGLRRAIVGRGLADLVRLGGHAVFSKLANISTM